MDFEKHVTDLLKRLRAENRVLQWLTAMHEAADFEVMVSGSHLEGAFEIAGIWNEQDVDVGGEG